MQRKIVIDTGCLHELNDDKLVLKMIRDCGFTSYDATLFWKGTTEHIGVGPDYPEKAMELRKYADSLGLTCEQAHSYFKNGLDEEMCRIRIKYNKIDMHIASILGAKIIVIHPLQEVGLEENVKYFQEYIPLAHKYNIKIAIENIWTVKDDKIAPMLTSKPEGLIKLIDTLNDEYVGACLDIGHAEMNQVGTSAIEMIKALGDRLICLHIHDNDKYSDAHQIPYTHKIPYKPILQALKETGYKGNITFEVETCYSKGENPDAQLPIELYPAFVKLELEIGKYFVNVLDN